MNVLEKYVKNELEMYCFLKHPKSKVPYLPSSIYIEPTNACNLNCIICARQKMQRKIGFMKFDDFKKIIDKFVVSNYHPRITLTGNGEPLLKKSIFKMIKYAKDRQFNVSMISNSTLLDEEKINLLISSGLDRYQTMFDSIDKESYEKIREKSNYEQTMKNIIKFIGINEENGHPIFISLGLVKTTLTKKIEETKTFWESYPIDNFFLSPLFSIQSDSGLYQEAVNSVVKTTYKICAIPWKTMLIHQSGDVMLCSHDFNGTFPVGNIFNNSIEDLWNGDNAQKIRRALLKNDLDYFSEIDHDCGKCSTPYTMNSIEDYLDSISSQIIRSVNDFSCKKEEM